MTGRGKEPSASRPAVQPIGGFLTTVFTGLLCEVTRYIRARLCQWLAWSRHVLGKWAIRPHYAVHASSVAQGGPMSAPFCRNAFRLPPGSLSSRPKRAFALALVPTGLLAVVFAAGCSSGPPISISLLPTSVQGLQQGQTVPIAATVMNDLSNAGVTWSLSGTGCAGASCGTLTNQTTASAIYNAPASLPSNLFVTVTATSVTHPSKSSSMGIALVAIAVTIQNKVTELAAGSLSSSFFSTQFSATVQNDPGNAGVTWTLTANGTPCSPACGTLSPPAGTFSVVMYTPPASVPTAPDNTPTISAVSVTNPVRSDADKFTIFDGSTACGTGGNEGLLNGQYAIMLQGWSGPGTGTPLLFGASFAADGTGKITGGADQFNPFLNHSYSGFGLIPSASSYSVGPDNRGCLTLTDQFDTTFTFRFSLGGISGGIASKGDIIFFNQLSATPEHASGILRRQDPTAFTLSALAPNYAIGLDGWENSKGPLHHFALVASFAQSGGSISNLSFDSNDAGSMSTSGGQQNGFFGTIQPIATSTGMAYATLPVSGPSPGQPNFTIYVISSTEIFFIATDPSDFPFGAVICGRAIATSSSFSASSISPNYIFLFTGNSSGAASASIGLASLSSAGPPGISGSVSGTVDQYQSGTASSQNLTGTYALGSLAGRLSITGAAATSPICYLTNPIDGVSAFCISMDASASLGVFDAQPAATYSSNSLSGNFYFGSDEPGDNTVPGLSGVASISSSSLKGVEDASSQSGLSIAIPFNTALSINADGSANLGPNTVAVTNGTVLYFIDETGNLPPLVQVFEP